MTLKDIFLSFFIGSSFLVTIFPLTYVGRAHISNPYLQYELVPIVIPLVHGVASALSTLLFKKEDESRKIKFARISLTGAMSGLVSSLLGISVGMNSELFRLSRSEAIISALVIYALIYSTVVYPLDILLGI